VCLSIAALAVVVSLSGCGPAGIVRKGGELFGAVSGGTYPSPKRGLGEPNNDKAHATLLKPGERVDGSLESTSDVDVFRIDRFAGASVLRTGLVGAIDIVATDSQGNQVGGSSMSGPFPAGATPGFSSTSVSINDGEPAWPIYITVKRSAGYGGKAEYWLELPSSK
jgi:hypothetical protein